MTAAGGALVLATVAGRPLRLPACGLRRRGRPASSSGTAASGSPPSATSATCGSSTRCGPGSSSSPRTSSTRARRQPRYATFAVIGGGRARVRRAAGWRATASAGPRPRPSAWSCLGLCALTIGARAGLARAGDRARLGLHGRRRLGAVLDARDRARRPGLRRHGADAAARGRLHAHGRRRSGCCPYLEDAVGWRGAWAFLAAGPALGVWAMLRLRGAPTRPAA